MCVPLILFHIRLTYFVVALLIDIFAEHQILWFLAFEHVLIRGVILLEG